MSGSNGLGVEMRVLVNSQMGLSTSAMDFSSQVRLSKDNVALQEPNCPFNRQSGFSVVKVAFQPGNYMFKTSLGVAMAKSADRQSEFVFQVSDWTISGSI